MRQYLREAAFCMAAGLAFQPAANGATYVNMTRVVISEKAGEAVPQLNNAGRQPILFQLWIDKGDASVAPETLDVPFVVDHPVFRLDAGKSKGVRIIVDPAQSRLPHDRESLFWLNVLEVPARSAANENNRVQWAFHSRMKLIYRPRILENGLGEALERLKFQVQCAASEATLRVVNPSAYHHTLLNVRLQGEAGDLVSADVPHDVLRPDEAISLALPEWKQAPPPGARCNLRTSTTLAR
ncbi:fimbrial biogenesis chaperone [Diaphorobacter aerolatus]|uniref:Fimbria/pilus periplasmic chaperone n=1 Tax=Diaphorobacter aerolatus TaxID=1288495 RepID=A0A7H0GHE2_9BURK|nr:fimbria/pilus periplasmic chaperone [Diaphorobacter aerolatus]QNP47708.1 fimbria/pilus periplasmic chaperone [Diaphorobacter aerolatus]